jgi:8-oxo-dGTP pyrophosphatase MutT (NUDIX family)
MDSIKMRDSSSLFYTKISRLLNSRQPRKLERHQEGRAAVLMPIFQKENDYFFLLTQRTHMVETHKGQISFPGGIAEGDETLIRTALRETWEEIGLASERIELLGEFDEYLSVTGLIVTPFVAAIDYPFDLNPNLSEVEEILQVPLILFEDGSRLRVETRRRFDRDQPVYFYNFQGRDVWGLTAQIIRDFILLLGGSPGQ